MEVFKDIKGYEGLYKVSNRGRVKSFIKWRGSNERILSSPLNSDGYPMVGLIKDGVRKSYKVHVLVAMEFLGHVPEGNVAGNVIDHIDFDRTNNNVDNLRIVSHRENCVRREKKYTSKYVGVSWDKFRSKWVARINANGKYKFLGRFKTEEEASKAYQKELLHLL